MGTPTDAESMNGTVRVDETMIGGKANRMNTKQRASHGIKDGDRQLKNENKSIVLTAIDNQGEARSQVINDVTSATLDKHLSNMVRKADTHLQTDELAAYRQTGSEMASRQAVDHSRNEYARGTVTTNPVESYFSQLKRSIDGTRHYLCSVHQQRYLSEFDYRSTTRAVNDSQRLAGLVAGNMFARPLPYDQLIGKV